MSMSNKEQKQLILEARKILRFDYTEDREPTDQMRKIPQPPLVKEELLQKRLSDCRETLILSN